MSHFNYIVTSMKTCSQCNATLPIEDFYFFTRTQRHHAECKKCSQQMNRDWAKRNPTKVLAILRKYDENHPGRLAANTKAYRDRHPGVATASAREYIARNPQKRAAHLQVRYALLRGDLKRLPCEDCGSTKRIGAHHEDYSKPLDVNWLCHRCHMKRHRRAAA